MKSVASRDNASYKAMQKLVSSATERKKRGLSVLDGVHLVEAFLDAGHPIDEVMINGDAAEDPEIAMLLKRAGIGRVTLLSEQLFNSLSTVDAPTGILAAVRTPEGRDVPPSAPFVLMLEDIQDPGNVGALLRSAAAAGVAHVLLSPRCAFAWSPKVLRAAMGGHFALNIVEGADLPEYAVHYEGTTIALAGEGGRALYDLDLRMPCAFIVGNEGAGISRSLASRAKVTARIPTSGKVESLNAAIAGSVALFECARQRAAAKGRD